MKTCLIIVFLMFLWGITIGSTFGMYRFHLCGNNVPLDDGPLAKARLLEMRTLLIIARIQVDSKNKSINEIIESLEYLHKPEQVELRNRLITYMRNKNGSYKAYKHQFKAILTNFKCFELCEQLDKP